MICKHHFDGVSHSTGCDVLVFSIALTSRRSLISEEIQTHSYSNEWLSLYVMMVDVATRLEIAILTLRLCSWSDCCLTGADGDLQNHSVFLKTTLRWFLMSPMLWASLETHVRSCWAALSARRSIHAIQSSCRCAIGCEGRRLLARVFSSLSKNISCWSDDSKRWSPERWIYPVWTDLAIFSTNMEWRSVVQSHQCVRSSVNQPKDGHFGADPRPEAMTLFSLLSLISPDTTDVLYPFLDLCLLDEWYSLLFSRFLSHLMPTNVCLMEWLFSLPLWWATSLFPFKYWITGDWQNSHVPSLSRHWVNAKNCFSITQTFCLAWILERA